MRRGVGPDREEIRAENHRRVHADHLPCELTVAPVAGIERRIGLQHVVDEPPGLRAHRTPERAHDSRGHGVLEAVGTADRDRHLAHLDAARVAEDAPVVHGRGEADDGEVGVGIVPD